MNNTNSSLDKYFLEEKLRYLLVIPVIVLSFWVYLMTLTSDIGWSDSAELALQAYQLGVTHPPGYPIHSILGHLLGLFFNEPTAATTMLSAISTGLTAGILYITTLELTGNLLISFLSPFLFVFIPPIWDMAVVTEIYNVNTLFLSLSILLILLWRVKQGIWVLVFSGLVFGISLGTSLGNLLLAPAFVVFIFLENKLRIRNINLFFLSVLLTSIPALAYSVLRSFDLPPLGTQYLPTSTTGALKYFSGYQYGTLSIREASFYAGRTLKHAQIIIKNVLFIGLVFTAAGIYSQWKKERPIALFFIILLATNLLYFTYYPVRDYTVMVAPAYYVATIWMAYGFDYLYHLNWKKLNPPFKILSSITLSVLIIYQINSQYASRMEIRDRDRAERFTRDSFEIFPQDSAVLGNWSVITTMLYLQKTQDLRSDLVIIECNSKTRFYEYGIINNCWDFIESNIGKQPVVIEKRYQDILKNEYALIPLNDDWFLLGNFERNH